MMKNRYLNLITFFVLSLLIAESFQQNDISNSSNTTTNGTFDFNFWFPGAFWDLFLMSGIFILISFVGLCSIWGIQTHDVLPEPPK